MKRRFFAAAFVGFLSVGLSGTLLAVTRTVTSAADQGEGSLREAWFASASGDVIEVQEGLEILLESEMSVTNKTLTVRGLGSGATVNGQGKTAMFYLRSTWGSKPVLRFENITFTNGYSKTGGVFKTDGGGTQGSNKYELDNCRFFGNAASGSGGVIGSGGTWVINNCKFQGNHAVYGGVFSDCSYTLSASNSVFNANWSEKKGGVWGSDMGYPQPSGNWDLYKCDFIGNSVTNGGGGITCKPWVTFQAVGCKFNGNFVQSGSPVFGAGSAATKTTMFDGCEFCDNITPSEASIFEVLCSHSTTSGDADSWVKVRNSKISGNSAQRRTIGGAGSLCLVFENCLIENNVATTSGGWYSIGMFGQNFSGAQSGRHFTLCLTNSIFRNNANLGGGDGSLFWVYAAGTSSCLRAHGTLFEDNYGKSGAALFSAGGFSLELDSCTFKNNGVSSDGATTNSTVFSIAQRSAETHIRNCTFVGNWGTGTAWQKCGMIDVTATDPVVFDHCTFVSNHLLRPANASPSVLCNRGGSDLRISNCVFANNFSTAGADCPVAETKADISQMTHCKLTGTTNIANLDEVSQGVPFESLKFTEFGDNDNTNTLYGTEILPTFAIAKGSVLRNAGAGSLPVDARGFPRDAIPDVGAYEFQLKSGMTLIVR